MKQKFSIMVDENKDQLVIKEYAELDKEIMSLLCEEAYATKAVKAAMGEGKTALAGVLRTKNLYPPENFINQIADAVINMFENKSDEIIEIQFDDLELMASEKEADEEIEEEEIDDLLGSDVEDDVEEDFDAGLEVDNIKSPLKVADDDNTVIDEEN